MHSDGWTQEVCNMWALSSFFKCIFTQLFINIIISFCFPVCRNRLVCMHTKGLFIIRFLELSDKLIIKYVFWLWRIAWIMHESAPLNLRPWFTDGKVWDVLFRLGCCFKCSCSIISVYMFQSDAEKFVDAFITSRFDYCNALLIGCSNYSLKSHLIQNAAARGFAGISKRDYILPTLVSHHWFPVEKSRIDLKILLLITH